MSTMEQLTHTKGEPMSSKTELPTLEEILAAMEKHGEEIGDVSYEAGDLQELVRECWQHLPDEKRRDIRASFVDFIEYWSGDSDRKEP